MIALEDALRHYVHLNQMRSGGRFTRDPSTFANRAFCRSTLTWRILEAEELTPDDSGTGYGNYLSVIERIRLMSIQPDDFPSSPHRPSKYVVRFESSRGLAVHGFMKPHIARVFIDQVTSGEKTRWASGSSLTVSELELMISCPQLEEIMETTQGYDLPSPYPFYVEGIRGTPYHYDPTPPKAEKPKREKKQRAPAASAGEGTHLSELADELGIETRRARAILRKAGIGKPYQWTDTAPILKILRAAT